MALDETATCRFLRAQAPHALQQCQHKHEGATTAFVTLGEPEEAEVHEVPYPALRRQWKTLMSFPWDREGQINELELGLVKHRGRSAASFRWRWFLIVDSMVIRGALAKGRSPSRWLHRLLRRQAATELALDSHVLPLWTIS